MSIKDNLTKLKNDIREIAVASMRNPDEIELVAVTKMHSADEIKEIIESGHFILGENRVQEALEKIPQLPDNIRWHLIGHLQTNKVRDAVKYFELIHSVDSERLAEEIDRQAEKINKRMNILIEVNTSGEESKFGLTTKDAPDLIKSISAMQNIRICGLMTMAPFVDDDSIIRHSFRELRLLRDKIAQMHLPNVEMKYLSMGMTNDYKIAIEEGANLLRIGSAIFRQD